MDIRKKILSIVGVLALTTSMSAGIVAAQDVPTSSSAPVTITVVCATTNTFPSTASLGINPDATDVNFGDFDPAGTETSSSTAQKALRLNLDIDPCEPDGWSVTASVTDFYHGSSTAVISGENFTLPNGEPNASEFAESGGVTVTGVVGPASNVLFTTNGGFDTEGRQLWNGSVAIASHDGTSDVSGQMHLDYTGTLSGLDDTLESGTYTAEITVTFSAGDQP